jgi:hypothetical protein
MVLYIAYGKPDTVIANAVKQSMRPVFTGLLCFVPRSPSQLLTKTGKVAMTVKSNALNYPARSINEGLL